MPDPQNNSHNHSHATDADTDNDNTTISSNNDNNSQERSIFINLPLPPYMLDEHNLPIIQYPRNKIRTTKYKPLSFIPKNLLLQFKNVANIYFLFLVILGAFPIFGVDNPGLAAVPLIVIVCITAIKDAIEDYRRTSLDLELNNTLTHILRHHRDPNSTEENGHVWENVNVRYDQISLWRRFKKWCMKLWLRFYRSSKSKIIKKNNQSTRNIHNDNESIISSTSLESKNDQIIENNNHLHSNNPFITPEELSKHETSNSNSNSNSNSIIDSKIPISHETKFYKDYWKNIKVGDILRIHNNEEIPADMIILSSSDDDGGCYIETKNLDGESNLKVRQSLNCSQSIKSSKLAQQSKFWIESEAPNSNLYTYNGVLKFNNQNNEEKSEAITINNILLRGCSLRNTKWVIAVVVFTGSDTKIMLNAGITPTKRSRITRELNFSVIMNFVLLFLLCFIAGLVNGIFYNKSSTSRKFFEFKSYSSKSSINGILGFFVGLILYQSLVPISLYISIEIIKTLQAFFIYCDVLMYFDKLDYPCTPKSWNISDDLGQIEYIFSDKTGTLTQNLMEFKKCTINGKSYGKVFTEAMAGSARQDETINNIEELEKKMKLEILNDKKLMINELNDDELNENELTFISSDFIKDLKGENGFEQQESNKNFMLSLSLCHTVLTESSTLNPSKILLKAQSPDEAALVSTARDVGFKLITRTKNGLIVNIQGKEIEFEILNVLEFNSTRKRMSAIVKLPSKSNDEDDRIVLICKGADSIIYNRLKKNSNKEILEKTALHLEQFATEGLRTLCIAQRELSLKEYNDWNLKHEKASSAIKNREEQMELVADLIETDLTLLGGTAIEDKLQDGVPDSIELLGKAGIKLWVLTGDKVETAINIGFSCNLLDNGMELLVIKLIENSKKLPSELIDHLISKYLKDFFAMDGSFEELDDAKLNHSPPSGNFAVIIDGDALKQIEISKDLQRKFLLLCKQCRSVLCCRVSPAQKAFVVRLVKNSLDVMTLAIGDGSNDVAMIQEADVGVGIAGEEGRQAVMSSDFAIAQFRFLTRLVLIHGRWSYKRLSEMIPSFFYKNVIYTLALFWYGIYNDFDGSYLFEYTYLMFYNLAFTSLPVIFLGVLDQDVSAQICLIVPQLYRSGILRNEWNQTKFWGYMMDGAYQSIIAFFYPYIYYYQAQFVSSNGLPVDHRYEIGILVTAISIVSANLYVLSHQYRWDWLSLLIITLSILIFYGWTGIWTVGTRAQEFYRAASNIFGTLSFWIVSLVGVITCLLPRFVYDVVQKIYIPSDLDIIRERVKMGDFDQYPVNYDPTDPNIEKIKNTQQLQISSSEQELENDNSINNKFNVDPEMGDIGIIQKTPSPSSSGGSTKLNYKSSSTDKINTQTTLIVTESNNEASSSSEIPSVRFERNSLQIPTNSIRQSLDQRRIQMFEAGQYNPRVSLDRTRSRPSADLRRSIDQNQNPRFSLDTRRNRVSFDRARASMELPGLTNAETLMSQHSKRESIDEYDF